MREVGCFINTSGQFMIHEVSQSSPLKHLGNVERILSLTGQSTKCRLCRIFDSIARKESVVNDHMTGPVEPVGQVGQLPDQYFSVHVS